MKTNYQAFRPNGKITSTSNCASLFLAIILSVVFAKGYSQTYTFTPAGATGSLGPTQLQVTQAYQATSLSGSVDCTGGIQSWTVPSTGSYKIEAWGAGGYGTFAGRGAYMKGDFALTAGQVLKIVVGQMGVLSTNTGYSNQWGGGGGSYIVTSANAPLLVAGGGGGSHALSYQANSDGTITANGNIGVMNTSTWPGGINGLGGTNGSTGDAGGGFTGDGMGTSGGKAFLNGSNGGSSRGIGGFGGGGGTSGSNNRRAGGGGGYSGGGGAGSSTTYYPQGGGGGSFNSGTNQANTSGVNTAEGKVIIEHLCNISLTASGVGANNSICTGNSVTLTTNAISNYSWSNGATTSSIVVFPTANTMYSLTAISPLNCQASALITISVATAVPNLVIASTANSGGICPSNTLMLTASGATSYTWTGGSVPVTNGVAFTPGGNAVYTVQSANACGTGSAVTSASIHPLPTVNPSASSPTLCAGSGLTLTAAGNAANYAWSGGNAPSGNSVGFTPLAGTVTYSVIGTSALTCTAQATIPVTIHATPNAAPSANPLQVCIGNSSTLTATGATSYTWASSTHTVFTNAFVVTPAIHGVSTYTVTKANSTCTDTKTISVTTNSLPGIFAMVTPTVVCALQPATLTIGGGTSYTWTAPATPNFTFGGASPVVYPQAPAEYTVAASDGTCISVTTVSLSVDPNPTITLSASAPSLCVGAAVTMTALGGNSYTWTSSSSTSTLFTQIITESPTIATSYNVTGNNSFGCTASANQVVIVHNTPPLTVTSSKNLVCSGDPSTLTASGANTYTWDPNNALTPTTIVNPVALSSGPVEYTVSGSYSSTGCMSTKTIQVNVYMPVLTITGNTNTCKDGQISLSASGGNPNTYSWNTGTNTFNFPTVTTTLSAPAIFTVSATSTSVSVNTAVCPVSQAVAVGIHFNPTITAVADRTTIICQGESVELRADGALTYTWSNSFGGATITVIPPFQTNNYVVRGTDINGCVASATVQVKINSCLGIQESSKAALGLVVYPNPNKGTFTIESGSNLDLVIANELGQVVRSITLSGDTKYTVTVNDLAKGIYFLSGRNTGSQIHQKIIVD